MRYKAAARSLIETFWMHVEKSTDPDACWRWSGPLLNRKLGDHSYGIVRHKGFRELAHRFAFELAHGPLKGKWALHRCDNPRCVNPAHIYPGTPKDNSRDVSDRDRHPPFHPVVAAKYASKYPCALSDALTDANMSVGELASRMDIPTQTIYAWMRSGRRPSDSFAERLTAGLGRPFSEVFGDSPYVETPDGRTKRTQSKYDHASRLRADGFSFREISEAIGVHQLTVYRWLNPEYAARILRSRQVKRQQVAA